MPLSLVCDRNLGGFDLRGLTPDFCRGRTLDEIRRHEFVCEGELISVGEVWRAQGDLGDGEIVIEADCSRATGLGSGMASGKLTIKGSAGEHAGSGMSGGSIEIEGSSGDWLGAEMSGGSIRVQGDAGAFAGSAYPGSRMGMRDGLIAIAGSCGANAGLMMRRGLVAIGGDAGEAAGRGMIAGSIFVLGALGPRPGSGMKRGTIATFGSGPEVALSLPLGFIRSGNFRPHILNIYLSRLIACRLDVRPDHFAGRIERWNGDFVERGLGEVLIWSHD